MKYSHIQSYIVRYIYIYSLFQSYPHKPQFSPSPSWSTKNYPNWRAPGPQQVEVRCHQSKETVPPSFSWKIFSSDATHRRTVPRHRGKNPGSLATEEENSGSSMVDDMLSLDISYIYIMLTLRRFHTFEQWNWVVSGFNPQPPAPTAGSPRSS